jgi:hypothetical protein
LVTCPTSPPIYDPILTEVRFIMNVAVTNDEYRRLYRAIERVAHPDLPPATPDPVVATVTWDVFEALGRVETSRSTD